MTRLLRACILEDHVVMREHLRDRVASRAGRWIVASCGADVDAAIEIGEAEPFDCVVMDLDLGDSAEADDLERLARHPWPIVVVSASGDPERVQRAVRAGALAYVSKHGGLAELAEAMDSAVQGRMLLSPDLAAKLAVPRLDGVTLPVDERRGLMLRASGLGFAAIGASLGCDADMAEALLRNAVTRYRKQH